MKLRKKTKEQLVKEILDLEIESGKLEAQAGCSIQDSKLFSKHLKIIRKLQKLRNQL